MQNANLDDARSVGVERFQIWVKKGFFGKKVYLACYMGTLWSRFLLFRIKVWTSTTVEIH